MSINPPLGRKLRMGLIGGGQGSFIGRVHAMAATMDNRAALVAGALSSDPNKAKASAPDYDIQPDRAYGSFHELVARESELASDQRIDFVSIATPNHTHFEIARACIEAGFNVMCDKPMTFDLRQAESLAEIAQRTRVVFGLTHNYTGYPLVRQARDMIRAAKLGEINAVRTFYMQGWLRRTPADLPKRSAWKTDPERAGSSGCFGDIGIHAYNLCRFVTGLLPDRIACHLKIFTPAGRLDDYGSAVVGFSNGAMGTITASRISHARANDLWIEIDGTRGALEWHQEEPNKLWFRVNGQPQQLYTRDPNAPFTTETARASCRLPAGHPEGYLEAFANVYCSAFNDMACRATGAVVDTSQSLYPNVADGVDGLNFITQCVASARQEGAWLPLRHPLCRAF